MRYNEDKTTERKVITVTTPLFLFYPKCATCKKAQKWLDENGVAFEARDIVTENPTEDELRAWHKASGLPLKKFFNTSGKKYKEQHLKDKLPDMSEDEQFRLLATDGLLVKRPILVNETGVLVGFKEADWETRLANATGTEKTTDINDTDINDTDINETNESIETNDTNAMGIEETNDAQDTMDTEEPKDAMDEPPATAEQPPQEATETAELEKEPPRDTVSVRAFQMKITLRGMKPPVWRRFFVPEDMTFDELSDVLIRVMGWAGYHMAAFELPKSGMNIIAASWTDEMELGERNGKTVKLSDFLPAEKKFVFVYDMGDNWEHEVVIEDVRENYPARHAAVLAYEGNCPPDDSGGVWGYMDMLKEDDEDTKAWLEENSTVYNMEETNAELKEMQTNDKA